MATTPTIPKIAVTHDEESLDDETNYLSLTEALTDIEDLDGDEGDYTLDKHKKEIKSKLKIRMNQEDALTDLEDFEDSDEETDKSIKMIIPHSEPISLDDLDLEEGIFEESYKMQVKTPKGKRKLKTQCSTSQIKSSQIDYKVFENYTDEEIFDTDNEVLKDSVPETDVDLDSYNLESINVSDNINKTGLLTPLSNINFSDSNDSDSSFQNGQQFLSVLSQSPNLSDLTDVEVLLSDPDCEKSFKKVKPRRRRHRGTRKASVTDVEDLDVSDDDIKFTSHTKPKRKIDPLKLLTKAQSQLYDTDNEESVHLPFPVCKKIAEKKQNILNIPEFDTNFPTDVEDFDDISEQIDTPIDSKEEEDAFEEKLNDIATCYSNVKEAHSSLKSNEICRTQSVKSDDTLEDPNNTDSDICQTENSDKDTYKEEESIGYDIKFKNTSTKIKKKKSISRLDIIPTNEDPLTDYENVDTSDDDHTKTIPIALAKQTVTLTDEEEFEDDFDENDTFPEIILPPVVRNLVILKENEPFPTIQILPLPEETSQQPRDQSINIETDEESVSEAEEAVEGVIPVSISDFNVLDCGVIKESENIHDTPKKLQVPLKEDYDNLTDTEELILRTRRRRAPKFKHMHERFMAEKNKLCVKNEPSKGLTDTEDVVLSDSEQFHSLSPMLNLPDVAPEGLTDTEILGDTSDEEKQCNIIRDLSCTPQHMREMGGDMVMNKESSGPFSLQDRAILNEPVKMVNNIAVTPVHTDTEDLVGSADEDLSYSRADTATPNQIHIDLNESGSSKVISESKRKISPEGCMYLKGGGYFESLTDVEYISEEDKVNKPVLLNLNWDSKILINLHDGSAFFKREQEWEASRQPQPLKLEPTAPSLEKDAAQKGGDQIISSTSVRETTSSSTRPEGEEGAEKEESGYEREVADQHQLSEEMKELLKELEKESKQ